MSNPSIYVFLLNGTLKASCDRTHEGGKFHEKIILNDPRDKTWMGGKALLLAIELAEEMGWKIPFCDWVVGQINSSTFSCTPIGDPDAYEPEYYCGVCNENYLKLDLTKGRCPACGTKYLQVKEPTPYLARHR